MTKENVYLHIAKVEMLGQLDTENKNHSELEKIRKIVDCSSVK